MAKLISYANGTTTIIATGLTVADAKRNAERLGCGWEAESPVERMAQLEYAAEVVKATCDVNNPAIASTLRAFRIAWKQAQAEALTAERVSREVAEAADRALASYQDGQASWAAPIRAAEQAEYDRAADLAAEAAADRAQTVRDETAKAQARLAMEAPASGPARPVANGYYTVARPDGSHITFRVVDDFRDNAPVGGQMVKVKDGYEFIGFGFLSGTVLTIWKKMERRAAALRLDFAVVQRDSAAAGEAYALASGNCYRCNRMLTVPASIHRGLGPDCAKKG